MTENTKTVNADSKALQEQLDEVKVTKMLDVILTDVFEKFHPTNAEMVVLALMMVRMMLQRSMDTKTGYPAKMQISAPSGHTIFLEVKKPTTDALKQAMNLIESHKPPIVN